MNYNNILFWTILTSLLLTSTSIAAQRDSSEVLPSGHSYRIVVSQPDSAKLEVGDVAEVIATLTDQRDSVIFTNNNKGEAPMQVPVRNLNHDVADINPIDAILPRLRAGEVAHLFIRLDALPKPMPNARAGDSVLIYQLEIVRVLSAEQFSAQQDAAAREAAAARKRVKDREPLAMAAYESTLAGFRDSTLEQVEATVSGLQYVILRRGEGELPEVGEVISVNYIGALTADGTVFDQSFIRGEGINFNVGTGVVIPGFDEGLLLLPHGSHAVLFIPAELGYGEHGTGHDIPPNAHLTFYVEVD